jgi:hypothetical protein
MSEEKEKVSRLTKAKNSLYRALNQLKVKKAVTKKIKSMSLDELKDQENAAK